jgi:hypothetical protein
MKELPAGYVEVSKGVYERRDLIKKGEVGRKTILQPKNTRRNRKPKPPVHDGAVGSNEGEKAYTGRIHVRVTVCRKILCDPDNSTPKYVLDCVRLAGLIPNDREQDITLETRQEKTRGEETTLIELFRYEPKSLRC